MKKKFIKKILEDLRISLLNFSFVMIYIIHEILVLIKSYLNYFKYNTFECFLKNYNRLLLFFKINFFHNI